MEIKDFHGTLDKLTSLKDSVSLYEDTIRSIEYVKDCINKRATIIIKFPDGDYVSCENLAFSMPCHKVLEILQTTIEEQKQYLKSHGIICD